MSERWYDIPEMGIKLPSVTTVLGILDKPYLRQWAVNQAVQSIGYGLKEGKDMTILLQEAKMKHKEVADDAANVGTKTHKLINYYFTHYDEIKDPLTLLKEEKDFRIHACFRAFNQWRIEHEYYCFASEKFVFSGRYKVAGTLDSVGTIFGRDQMVLLDFKSNNNLWDISNIQISAYAMLWEFEKQTRIEQAILIKLGKDDGTFETKEITRGEIKINWQTFKYIIEVFYRIKTLEKKNKEYGKVIEKI